MRKIKSKKLDKLHSYIDRSRTLKYSLNRTFLTNIKHLYVLFIFSIRLPSRVASLWVEMISEDLSFFLQFLCLKLKFIYSENLKKSPSQFYRSYVMSKLRGRFLQIFVAFLENFHFTNSNSKLFVKKQRHRIKNSYS